jgi:hypothetical protein
MVFAADDCCVGIAPVEHVVLSVSYGVRGGAANPLYRPQAPIVFTVEPSANKTSYPVTCRITAMNLRTEGSSSTINSVIDLHMGMG